VHRQLERRAESFGRRSLKVAASIADAPVGRDGLMVAITRGGLGGCFAAGLISLLTSTAGAAQLRKVEVEDLHAGGDPVFVWQAVVSPDGAHVYSIGAEAWDNDPIVQAFARAADGSLTPIESERAGLGSYGEYSLALSPDGRHLYAGARQDQLVIFERDPATGELTLLEVSFEHVSGNLVASPDGRNVYATFLPLLMTYTRDETTGALTLADLENGVEGPAPINLATALAISPDGRHLYLGSVTDGQSGPDSSLIVFSRDETTGALELVEALFEGENGVDGLSFPVKIAVSGDGRNVYVSGSAGGSGDDVASFARDDATGELTFLGKAAGAGFSPDFAGGIVVSPDGERVLVTGDDLGSSCCARDGISIFRRNPVTGLLSFLEALMRDPAAPTDLTNPTSLTFAADGRDVYATGSTVLAAYRVLPHCSAAPLDGCRTPMGSRRSQILLAPDPRDTLLWRWPSGQVTSAAEFGDPRSMTDYAFCVHRESAGEWQAEVELVVPASSTCGDGDAPCWHGLGTPAGSRGYVFRDPALGDDGVEKLQLRRGSDGRAAIVLRGRGTAVDLPELPFPPYQRIVAQLRNGDGTCWSAEYGAPATIHHATRFADRSD
jgi:6-phosphogluconolactonase (cycloisomerase 2 family)